MHLRIINFKLLEGNPIILYNVFRMPPKKGKVTRFHNCKLLRNHQLIHNDYLYVRDGKIINGEKLFFEERIPPDEHIDCENAIICPGFIEIQINGKNL